MARRGFVVAMVCLGLGAPALAQGDAAGHKVVRVQPTTARDLQTILALSSEVWSCNGAGLGRFDVQVSPEQLAALERAGIAHEVYIDDVQRLLDETWTETLRRREQFAADGPGWYEAFRTYDEINTRLDELAAAHPNLATVSTAGMSLEGRPIRVLKFTGPGSTTGRPAFLINGCQHAREWISPMVSMYMAEQLLERYDTDCRVRDLVDRVEFWVAPVANPDGYAYTWTNPTSSNVRLWRKNRRPGCTSGTSPRFGVDLNRNWSVGWGNNNGSSPDPCNETYRGTAAFSEPETQAISGLANQLGSRLATHLDVHSYAQQFLSPWGYTEDPPPHLALMDSLGARWSSEVATLRGTQYEYGQGSIILYISSGASRDFSYGTHGAMAWTIELTDAGGGFVAPPAEILPAGQENLLGLLRLAEYWSQPLNISLSEPAILTPSQPTPLVVTIENSQGTLQAGSAQLYARVGTAGTFIPTALAPAGGSSFSGTLPAAPCAQVVQYYIQAQTTDGRFARHPACGQNAPLQAVSIAQSVVFADDMEAANPGWTVQSDAGITAGAWVRADPVGTSNQGQTAQPESDFTPAPGVNCYVTQNGSPGGAAGAADVDGGSTRLTSPVCDLSGAQGARVQFARWAYSVNGNRDPFVVEVSNDNGQAWTPVSATIGSGGWVVESFNVQDFVPLSAQVRVRFTARDNPNDSLTEACLDDFSVAKLSCPATCYADCNGDGALNLADFGCFQTKFASGDPYADCNGDGQRNLSDFGCFQTAFALGCP